MAERRTRCPICGRSDSFRVDGPWLREQMWCTTCAEGSVPRERALAVALETYAPRWAKSRVLECSPAPRGISRRLGRECRRYTAMNYFPDRQPGTVVDGVRNEDLQALTFADGSFDLFVALDVLEHIPRPELAVREISRVVTPDGYALLTFPIRKWLVDAVRTRARLLDDGTVEHLEEPEWHGNPYSAEGSLVFTDFGYDVHRWLQVESGRSVHVLRFADPAQGVEGELTDVCVLGPVSPPAAAV